MHAYPRVSLIWRIGVTGVYTYLPTYHQCLGKNEEEKNGIACTCSSLMCRILRTNVPSSWSQTMKIGLPYNVFIVQFSLPCLWRLSFGRKLCISRTNTIIDYQRAQSSLNFALLVCRDFMFIVLYITREITRPKESAARKDPRTGQNQLQNFENFCRWARKTFDQNFSMKL